MYSKLLCEMPCLRTCSINHDSAVDGLHIIRRGTGNHLHDNTTTKLKENAEWTETSKITVFYCAYIRGNSTSLYFTRKCNIWKFFQTNCRAFQWGQFVRISLCTFLYKKMFSYCVIVRVSVVLKRTVVGDWRFDNLSGSHLQSQVNSFCQSMLL